MDSWFLLRKAEQSMDALSRPRRLGGGVCKRLKNNVVGAFKKDVARVSALSASEPQAFSDTLGRSVF
jgi:hypothetical protein